ncbi:MAG: response regulator [Candidatus Ancaeobacter aquaticus]|nr:response regulator [Candidatus Ancaeobacter aquaticus]
MSQKKVLIIEDEIEQVHMLRIILESKGYDCVWEVDGEKAVSSILREKPDLILLDILMPNIDGYELCKEIKNVTDLSKIPIIAITASGDPLIEESCNDVGIDMVVRKPYVTEDVMEKIQSLLG